MKRNNNIIKNVIKNQAARIEATKNNHLMFFYVYFSQYVQFAIASFHKKIFKLTQDEKTRLSVIVSFRGSAKSTLITQSFPLWAILGHLQKRFVVIISQTQEQARQHFKNIRTELEENELLKQDLGPFETQNEWNNCSLIIPRYNAKIIAVSREQSFRGVRFGRFRPDLIIADDCEDMASVKTVDSRKNTRDWFGSEVLPLGDQNTRILVVGNLLHSDSLLMNLKKDIRDGTLSGTFDEFPLINEEGASAWPGKYPNLESIKEEERNVGNKFIWAREYLLKIIDDTEPVVSKESIEYYDKLPEELPGQRIEYLIGVDLALGEDQKHDFTGIVSAKVYYLQGKRYVFILSNPLNIKSDINKILEILKTLVASYGDIYKTRICIEGVMLQKMVSQLLSDENYLAEAISIGQLDKRERLSFSSNPIYSGEILFPKVGCKELLEQITEFGTTAHDDLVDAFSIIGLKLIDENRKLVAPLTMEVTGLYNHSITPRNH